MATGAKTRVYEVAREVGIANKDRIDKIRGLGLEVNNHMSSLNADDVDRVERSIEKGRLANTVTKRLSSTVLRRRSKRRKADDGAAAAPAEQPPATPAADDAEPAPRVRRRVAKVAEPEPVVEPTEVEPEPVAEPVAVEAAPEPVAVEAEPAAPELEAEPAAPAAPQPGPAPPAAQRGPHGPRSPAVACASASRSHGSRSGRRWG